MGDFVADVGPGANERRDEGVGQRVAEVELEMAREQRDEAERGGERVLADSTRDASVVDRVGQRDAAYSKGQRRRVWYRRNGKHGGEVGADAAALAANLLRRVVEQTPRRDHLLLAAGHVLGTAALQGLARGDGVSPHAQRRAQLVAAPLGLAVETALRGQILARKHHALLRRVGRAVSGSPRGGGDDDVVDLLHHRAPRLLGVA
ncbi:hypothetical protein BBAD15_g8431 [Beauveria bassiana D1-5]|uniref:Uncharacterized protein n=1 Tax=Beauveria bassiana D1-5 TaxID=1245745 RepID=A0A0A2VFC9_BEABA|nr:hypothetical protein BBAD15_g8431 [Beauveria bassiana D1-5]